MGDLPKQHALRWLDAKRGASRAVVLRGTWHQVSTLNLADVVRRLGSPAVASLELRLVCLPSSALWPLGEGAYPSLTRLVLEG